MVDSWELEVAMSCLVWVGETELVSAGRAADAPHDHNIPFLIIKKHVCHVGHSLLERQTSTHSEQSCTDRLYKGYVVGKFL